MCYADGMTGFLSAIGTHFRLSGIRGDAARPRVRERVATVAAEAGVEIESIAQSHIRKEAIVANVLNQRGDHPGLVHILSAMEACPSYQALGMTSRRARPTCVRTAANACITISTSWTPISAWSICACRPGRRSVCNSTATVTIGWPVNCRRKDRVHRRRQRFPAHRRLASRAGNRRRIVAGSAASCARSTTRHLCCPVLDVFGPVVPLEPDAGRIRHRPGVPFRHHTEAAV